MKCEGNNFNPKLPCIDKLGKRMGKPTTNESLQKLHNVVVGLIKLVESLTDSQKDTMKLIDQLDFRLTELKERVSFSCGANLYKIKYLDL